MIKIRLKDISRVIKRRFLLRQIVSIKYTDKMFGFIINLSKLDNYTDKIFGLMQIILYTKACIPQL